MTRVSKTKMTAPELPPYLLIFRDRLPRTRAKTSPREIGTVLSRWIEWHASLEVQGRIRFRGAIGSQSRRVSGPPDANASQVQTETADSVVGYLLIDAANFDEATEIASRCPGLEYGFVVEICSPFAPDLSFNITSLDRSGDR
jgi:hypothetical protein